MPHEISVTASAGHFHEPFLERASENGGSDGQCALAGFLTLRLVDQFGAHRLPPHPDALAYQCSATRDFLAEFGAETSEVNHLLEIMCVADTVRQTPGAERMLFPPLLAFAYWLERQLRLAEALDVLDTATRLSDGGVGEEEVQLWLQRGRVLRLSGRFDDAMDAYRSAGDLARAMEDRHSELLSRIGRGIVLMHLGNLPESERVLQRVLVEAREHGDRDAEARASQDLGNTYCHMQRTGLAIPLLFDAYRLYTDRVHQLRALSDLGIALKELGQLQAAEHAFVVVAGGEAPQGVRLTAALEVIETSVLRHDRVAFERWKRAVEAHVDAMPYLAVDFAEKVGLGYEHFGNRRLAAKHLSRALEMAERFGFNQRVFRIEQLRNDLEAGALEEPAVPQPHFDDAVRESLRTVAARLERDRLRHDSEAAMASSTAGTGL